MEVEIGIGKSGRRAYGFDDIAIVPSRRTRDPEDVDISWDIDAFKFELPVIGSAMDGVLSPSTAIELGNQSVHRIALKQADALAADWTNVRGNRGFAVAFGRKRTHRRALHRHGRAAARLRHAVRRRRARHRRARPPDQRARRTHARQEHVLLSEAAQRVGDQSDGVVARVPRETLRANPVVGAIASMLPLLLLLLLFVPYLADLAARIGAVATRRSYALAVRLSHS